jgi:S1-C subfamily serine protease
MSRLAAAAAAVLVILRFAAAGFGAQPLTNAEIVKASKPAVALVDAKGPPATAFCIHRSGLFLTSASAVSRVTDSGTLTVVLNPGLENQRAMTARILRRDRNLDLALLQVLPGSAVADPDAEVEKKAPAADSDKPLDLPALALGGDPPPTELAEGVVFGFPANRPRARGAAYPTVTVSTGSISSLLTDAAGALNRIQVKADLPPGHIGSPLIDAGGKVVGVVAGNVGREGMGRRMDPDMYPDDYPPEMYETVMRGGAPGGGVGYAVPMRLIRSFLDQPVISLTAPVIKPAAKAEAAEFTALATSFLPDAKPMDLELVVSTHGSPERRVAMKDDHGTFRAKLVPFPPKEGGWEVPIEVQFPDGAVSGWAKDQALTVNKEALKLGEIQTITLGTSAATVLLGGKTLPGAPAGLETLTVRAGGQTLALKLASATQICSLSSPETNCLKCLVIARSGGKEIGRQETNVYLEGVQRATMEALRDGKFIKPLRSAAPTTYLKAISTAGDYIGQGKTFDYKGDSLRVQGNSAAVHINVGPWDIEFAAPQGQNLAPGEYPNAKRYPFNDDSPGLSFSGDGRGSNEVGGHFVVWELEIERGRITKFAVDFIYRSEGSGPPLYGMLRFNSSFE